MRSNNRFLWGNEGGDGLTVLGVFARKEDALRIEMTIDDDTTWIELGLDSSDAVVETRGDFRLQELADLVLEKTAGVTSQEELEESTSDDDISRCIIKTACEIADIDYDPDAEIVVVGGRGSKRLVGPTSPKKLGWKRVVN